MGERHHVLFVVGLIFLFCMLISCKKPEIYDENQQILVDDQEHVQKQERNIDKTSQEINIAENTEESDKEIIKNEIKEPTKELSKITNQTTNETNGKLDINNIETVTLATCEDALRIIKTKRSLALSTVLGIEKKCEDEEYFDQKVIDTILVRRPVENFTKEDCTYLEKRSNQLLMDNEDKMKKTEQSIKEHKTKLEQFQNEEDKSTQIQKQEDDMKTDEETLKDLKGQRERLVELLNIFRRDC